MQTTQIDHQSRTASHHMGSNQAAHAQLATGKGMLEGMNGRFNIGSYGGIGGRHPLPQSSYLNRTAGDVQGGRASFAWLDSALVLEEGAVSANLCRKTSQVPASFLRGFDGDSLAGGATHLDRSPLLIQRPGILLVLAENSRPRGDRLLYPHASSTKVLNNDPRRIQATTSR
jgi:hypothetical protein